MNKKLIAGGAGGLLLATSLVGCGAFNQANDGDAPAVNHKEVHFSVDNDQANDQTENEVAGNADAQAQKETDAKKAAEKAETKVSGDAVTNLREDVAPNAKTFCEDSKLPPGEGKSDKGGSCVSTQLGEIAKNPVFVALPDFPTVVAEGKSFTVKVQVEDKFGELDLNAFTHDENNKAGETFLERPGELDNDGRPLLHAHFGLITLKSRQGLPVSNDYDAGFTGVQGVKGDPLTVKVGGLKAGFYRADVYAGGPGHAPIPTALATQVQAFASVYFEVK